MEEITLEKVEAMNYRELQALAKTWSLKANGKREDLIGRLCRHMTGEANEDDTTAAVPRTPSAARSKKNTACMPPTTPATSLAKAFDRLSLNTPSATRATPSGPSRYNTRSSARKAKPVHSIPFSASDSKQDNSVAQAEPAKQIGSPALSPAATNNVESAAARLGDGEAVADPDPPVSTAPSKMGSDHRVELTEPDTVVESPQKSSQERSEDDAMLLSDVDAATAAAATPSLETGEDQNTAEEEGPRRLEEKILSPTEAAVDSESAARNATPDTQANAAADAASAAAVVVPRLNATTSVARSVACVKLFTEETDEAEQEKKGVKQQEEEGHDGTGHDEGEETMIQAAEGKPTGVSSPEGSKDVRHALPEGASAESYPRVVSPSPSTIADEDTKSLVDESEYLSFTDESKTRVVCNISGQEIAADNGSEGVQQFLTVGVVPMKGHSEQVSTIEEKEMVAPEGREVSTQESSSGESSGHSEEEVSTIEETRMVAPQGREVSTEESSSGESSQVSEVDEGTRNLVAESEILEFTEGEKRVVCSLTGQEIVPEYFEILKYLGSKKVQQLLKEGPFDIEEFAGMFIVEDLVDSRLVHCELTGVSLNKNRAQVKKHLSGQQYRLALQAISSESESR